MSEWTLCHDQVQSALNIKQLGGSATLEFGIIEMPLVLISNKIIWFIVGPLPRVRPRNGILALVLVVVVPLRSEFIGEL